MRPEGTKAARTPHSADRVRGVGRAYWPMVASFGGLGGPTRIA